MGRRRGAAASVSRFCFGKGCGAGEVRLAGVVRLGEFDKVPLLGIERMAAFALYSLACLLLDVCSLGALASGLLSGMLSAGLAIGYLATATAFLVIPGSLVDTVRQDTSGCAEYMKRHGEEPDQEQKTTLRRAVCCEACVVTTMVALVGGTIVALLYE